MKQYLNDCSRYAIDEAKPVKQLVADLLASSAFACHKLFAQLGLDDLGLCFVKTAVKRKLWSSYFVPLDP